MNHSAPPLGDLPCQLGANPGVCSVVSLCWPCYCCKWKMRGGFWFGVFLCVCLFVWTFMFWLFLVGCGVWFWLSFFNFVFLGFLYWFLFHF